MTGTSLDAVDAALLAAEGQGPGLRCTIEGFTSAPLDELAGPLRALAEGRPVAAGEIADAALRLGELCAEVGSRVAGGTVPDVCVIPGQTVHHAPPLSWQLVNPWPVYRALGCPVLFDVRSADIAAGGQGAPITPLPDWVLFRDSSESRVIVNLGGFCNATALPAGGAQKDVRGMDICVCNQLLDRAACAAIDRPFDPDGKHAERGTVQADPAAELQSLLEAQTEGGRSLGSGDEAFAWVDQHRTRLEPDDLLATAAAAIGDHIGSVCAALLPGARLLLAGGGALNRALVDAIAVHGPTASTAELGIDPQHREAAAMAVIGLLALDGIPFTLPQVTGRTAELKTEGAWIGRTP